MADDDLVDDAMQFDPHDDDGDERGFPLAPPRESGDFGDAGWIGDHAATEDLDYVEEQGGADTPALSESEVAGDGQPGTAASSGAASSQPPYSAEQHLMERFRLHKQHRREKDAFLKRTRQAAVGGASRLKPKHALSSQAAGGALKPSAGELTRVDHNNRPHRWKDAPVLVREMELRSHQKMLRDSEPVRPFPGRLRKKIFNTDSDEDAESGAPGAAEAAGAGSAASAHHALSDNGTAAALHTETDEFLKIDQSQFPLHLFDSDEFEMRTPEEWLASGDIGSSPYFIKGEWRWRKCAVQSYDGEKRKFLIQFQGSDRQKWVRRINVRFGSEPPELFQQRVDAAVRRREDAKAQLRFDHFLTKQSAAELKAMGRHALERIHQRVVSGLPERVALVDGQPAAAMLRALTDATIQGYMRSMKKAVLFDRLRRDPALQAKFTELNLLLPAAAEAPPEFGKIRVPAHAFAKRRKRIDATHFASSRELFSVLLRMYAGWEKTFQRLLLIQVDTKATEAIGATPPPTDSAGAEVAAGRELSSQFPFRLLDFKALQTNHQNKAAEILLTDWRRAIVENIIDNLQDQYDFFLSDAGAYSGSKLQRIITGVETRMAAHLRQIVTRSVAAWVDFVRGCCAASSAAPTVRSDAWRSPRHSLFDVQLAFVSGRVVVEPSAGEITAALLEPLDAVFASVHEIDALDCDILSLLNLPRRRLLDLHGDAAVVAECVQLIARAKAQITELVRVAMEAAQQVAAQFGKFTDFVHFDAAAYLVELAAQPPDPAAYLSAICAQIRRFHELSFRVDVIAFDATPLPLACVHSLALKQLLKARAVEIRAALVGSVVRAARERNMDITVRYKAILRRINEKPTNEAQLAKLKEFVATSKAVIAGIVREVDEVHARLDAMNEFAHPLSAEDFKLAYSTKEWPLRVAHAADSCDSALEEDKVRMMDKLALEKEAFELDLERFESDVQAFKLYGEIEQTEKYVELAVTLFDALQDAKAKAQDFNAREAVFNFPPTEYAILGKLEADFAPYYKLWTMCSEFNQSRQAWLNGPFLELKGPAIEALVVEWWKSSYKLSKTLMDGAPGSAEVALTLRERTEEFKAYLPVIQSLASPALQERHWESLRQKVGFEEAEEELTLQLLLDKGITAHVEAVQEVGTFAEKEYSLQKSLNAMVAEWEKIEFQCVPYRETGTSLLRSTDDIVALLDDHLVKTQTMRGSPYIKSIEKDCRAWEKKLQYAQQLLDEWMACQRTWLYLEAIFSSEDIMRQMPTEARRFASVDALWRKTMEDTAADPGFMAVVALDKLLQKFQKANEKLDEIQKGLNDYLEMKRLHFPRFFFLSNDELLEILSQTKEPKAVQPHLGKCFEGVNRVTFTDALVITEMTSAEGETVPLRLPVHPESAKNKGNVEMWLLELEQNQWDSVRDHTQRAIGTYPHEEREAWILRWPAQVVLAASQVYWTQDVTRAISARGNAGLREYVEALNAQLDKVVVLVRGNLTKLERTTIGALVVIDVHARDTVAHMIAKGVETDQDFEWISQLRYYWLDGAKAAGTLDLQARICKPEFKMKVVQFYETVQVRHGLMIVGQTGSGKTCIVHALAAAMTACHAESGGAAQHRFATRAEFIHDAFLWLVPPMLYFVDKHCAVPTPVTFLEHGASLLRLFECALSGGAADGVASDTNRVLECVLIKATVWSVGACVDAKSRRLFDRYLRDFLTGAIADAEASRAYFDDFVAKNPSYAVTGRGALLPVPEERLVYDYRFDVKKGAWSGWLDGAGALAIPRDAQFTSILVPTIDTERNAWILDTLLRRHFHVLCTGDTGTGKSVSIKKKIVSGLSDAFASILLNFSAQTSANQTQDLIESKLDKRRKGVLGPPLGVSCVVFVDDLNMPAKETYGAQPPIELLRQWMGHGGWYNRKDNTFTQLVDVQFVAAMGPPGGGRTRITQRYVRYFNLLNFVPFDTESLQGIFGRITDWFVLPFPGPIKQLAGAVVSATIDVYNSISSSLLPTPAKSHYTFNLRDLSKVFQGIAQATPDVVKDGAAFVRLWSHECLRVFSDRLTDDRDREWFASGVARIVARHFEMQYVADVRGPNATLIYGNFGDSKAARRRYDELRDRALLQSSMLAYLEDYNNMSAAPMRLVLFQNAIEHVARVSRVIHQPYGNALLVGVGGSGRKSLTTLAVFMADFKLFQIEISKSYSRAEWRSDLKKVLQLAGVSNQPTVFLFSDTQIVEEAYLEDINGLLNTGEVASLWQNDELLQISEALEPAAAAAGVNTGNSAEIYNFFVRRCCTNLHVVLALSPIGDAFRRRLRMFPSLVNCCTIDWFTEWPDEALRSVADHFLHDVELPAPVKAGIVDVCVDMQESMSRRTQAFLQSLRRHYYVTPTSYLELIHTFKTLLTNKRVEVMTLKRRYDNGLTKLMETAAQVAQMQGELEALQPLLRVATVETDALLETITREQKEANVTKDVVAAEEQLCNAQAAEANGIKESCEAELAEAIPALENAVKALQTLTKGDITEIKAMKKPPDGVKLVMEAVCIMMNVAPLKVKDPGGGTKKVDDYWVPAQKQLLSDTRFLQNLLEYDKDNIPPDAMEKVAPYAANPDFSADKIRKASVAASGLCSWVHAMVVYNRVVKVVAPKREALKTATATLAKAQSELKGKQDALQVVLDKVARLEADLAAAYKKKADLEFQVDDCSKKLLRATQLIGGLGGEKARWSEMSGKLQVVYDNVVGDIMLASGVIAYLGAFTSVYRETALAHWSAELLTKGIPCSDATLKVVKQSQPGFVRMLENSIMIGAAVLLEGVPEELDPMLEPVLLKQVIKAGGVATIRLGDNTIEYDANFRLYMTTKLSNPHYPPETCVKVNLLNFMATEEGLQDQMLGIVVAKEEPVLEQQREKLVLEDAANKKTLKEIEDKILYLLQSAEGNILDDERLIDTLGASKVTANKIEEKVREAAVTQQMIADKRQGYQPVAFRASQLFFCIADLSVIDPMYQYALEWFINLFVFAIGRADKAPQLAARLASLNDTFTYVLYRNVCRSLFEKDKLLFAFLLTVKVLVGAGVVNTAELRYFFTGNTQMELAKPKPAGADAWLTDKTWGNVLGLNDLPALSQFSDAFAAELPLWETCYNASDPADMMAHISSVAALDAFQRIVVLRCLRPDKVIPAVMAFVAAEMGQRFIEPQPFDLKAGFEDSSCATPLIFVLTPGADPMAELLKLAAELGFSKKFVAISLGQGQGPLAENAIAEAIDNGTWVCLQNCHLSVSWLPTLEKICEEITPDRVHASFRLWLTSEPTRAFPSFILQNGVKMTNEPPKGMRANLKGTYTTLDEAWVESCRRPDGFKKLLFGLCFFHAVVRERAKFGPLGWNIKYVFSSSDLNISKDQLKIALDELGAGDPIPYAALAYLAGECNYGGRVTDDKDRRCIVNILSDFYAPEILGDAYRFSASGVYFAPPSGPLASYLEYIDSLPMNEGPEIFGLHDNANISCAIAETNLLLESALSLQPRSGGGGGKSWDQVLEEAAHDIAGRVPPLFDNEKAELDFPVLYAESMNTVLTQELIRFNRLIAVITKSLAEVQRALKGLVVLSAELEAMGNSMVNGQVPAMWSAVAYPSLKPLGSWVTDFLARLAFLQDWLDRGTSPPAFWISGFFFTQAFITGTQQNFARKHQLPIDQIGYDMVVLSTAHVSEKAPDGAYVHGLFMEGARWDPEHMVVAESRHRELHVPMPVVHLLPKKREDIEPIKDTDPGGTAHVYLCPVYKTSLRQGTLSTTGHSTNFVMSIRVPMAPAHRQKHWIRRGVALLTQLDT
ncbi:hypothetical protein PybrP1_000394 [[Pythium] brassicae (nom. inval.)]|nr:hypothetical protein PybrP1_000394 [[Pythium] brassicae (nom. inval.)]